MLLTTKQVAERLAVADATVKRWIKAGKLPAMKIGRNYKIESEEVEKLINNSKVK